MHAAEGVKRDEDRARHVGPGGRSGLHRRVRRVDVVIPLTVIEELDSLKTRLDDVGRAARTALRTIEDLRVRAGGSLAEPVAVDDRPDAATLRIEINGVQKHLLVEHGLDPSVPDNRIIGAALGQAMARADADGVQRRRAADQGGAPGRAKPASTTRSGAAGPPGRPAGSTVRLPEDLPATR